MSNIRTNPISLRDQKAIIRSSASELATYEPDYAYLLEDLNRFNNAQWRYLIGEFRFAVLSGKALVYEQRNLLGTLARIVAEAKAVF